MLARVSLPDQNAQLFLGELAQLGVVARAHLLGRLDLLLEVSIGAEVASHGLEPRVFLRQIAKPFLVGDRGRVAQQTGNLLVALHQSGELLAQRLLHASAHNRRRNGLQRQHGDGQRYAMIFEIVLDALEQPASHVCVIGGAHPSVHG